MARKGLVLNGNDGKPLTFIGGDQDPTKWGLMRMLHLAKLYRQNPFLYFRHTVDGQSVHVNNVLKKQHVLKMNSDFALLARPGATDMFSLFSLRMPFGFSYSANISVLGSSAQSVSDMLMPLRREHPPRLEVFTGKYPHILKDSMTARNIGDLVLEAFLEYQKWIDHLVEYEVLFSESRDRCNEILQIVYNWCSSGHDSLTWLYYGLLSYVDHALVDLRDIFCKTTVDLFGDGTYDNLWVNPFYICQDSHGLLYRYPEPQEGYLFCVPRQEELYTWLRQNYVVVSGGIPYSDNIDDDAFRPQIQVNFEPMSAYRWLTGNMPDLLGYYQGRFRDVGMPTGIALSLASQYTKKWLYGESISVIDLYIIGGLQAVAFARKHATYEVQV